MFDDSELPDCFFICPVPDPKTEPHILETRDFTMPSADNLAIERAREHECEQQLRELQSASTHSNCGDDPNEGDEKDTEDYLAVAVNNLNVLGPSDIARIPCAAELLSALADSLPDTARSLLAHPDTAEKLPELVASLGAIVSAEEVSWSNDEVCSAGALLAAAVLTHKTRTSALRALHTLLDYRATLDQARLLGHVLTNAMPSPFARIELIDALRTGAGATSDRLAAELLGEALLDLLDPPQPGQPRVPILKPEQLLPALNAGWERLKPETVYCGVQLVGRFLVGVEPDMQARLLSAMMSLHDTHTAEDANMKKNNNTPAKLKVVVGLKKLQLLFGSRGAPLDGGK